MDVDMDVDKHNDVMQFDVDSYVIATGGALTRVWLRRAVEAGDGNMPRPSCGIGLGSGQLPWPGGGG